MICIVVMSVVLFLVGLNVLFQSNHVEIHRISSSGQEIAVSHI